MAVSSSEVRLLRKCRDWSDGVLINQCRCLYLKPVHRLNIRASIAIPVGGNSVDCLVAEQKRNMGHYGEQVMRRLRKLARPDEFVRLKVAEHSRDEVFFEADVESRRQVEAVSRRLDRCRVELDGQRDPVKIRVSEANHKPRQSRGGNIQVIADTLPSCWFADSGSDQPSRRIIKSVFAHFGPVEHVEINEQHEVDGKDKKRLPGGVFSATIRFTDISHSEQCVQAFDRATLLRVSGDRAWTLAVHVDSDQQRSAKKRGHPSENSDRKLSRQHPPNDKDELMYRRKVESLRLLEHLLEQASVESSRKEDDARTRKDSSGHVRRDRSRSEVQVRSSGSRADVGREREDSRSRVRSSILRQDSHRVRSSRKTCRDAS